MQANIMKVKSCSEQFYVKSEKADNGQMAKRNLVLQEIGGKFENSYRFQPSSRKQLKT